MSSSNSAKDQPPAKVKRFSFQWGSGYVAEEVQVDGQYHRPTIQLLKYTDGDAAGQETLRFCSYSSRGGFQRSPLMVSPEDIGQLREALRQTPKLRSKIALLLESMADDSEQQDLPLTKR